MILLNDEFRTDSELEEEPEAEDIRFVEPDGTLSEVEEEEPPNFSAVGPGTVSGTVDYVALAQLMDAFGETDPILPERKTQLIEDTEPELCLAPQTEPKDVDEKEPEPEPAGTRGVRTTSAEAWNQLGGGLLLSGFSNHLGNSRLAERYEP